MLNLPRFSFDAQEADLRTLWRDAHGAVREIERSARAFRGTPHEGRLDGQLAKAKAELDYIRTLIRSALKASQTFQATLPRPIRPKTRQRATRRRRQASGRTSRRKAEPPEPPEPPPKRSSSRNRAGGEVVMRKRDLAALRRRWDRHFSELLRERYDMLLRKQPKLSKDQRRWLRCWCAQDFLANGVKTVGPHLVATWAGTTSATIEKWLKNGVPFRAADDWFRGVRR